MNPIAYRDRPEASRIATFANDAEVFIATEQGAALSANAMKAGDWGEPREGPPHLLLVEARERKPQGLVDPAEDMGIFAKHFTSGLQDPHIL